MVTDVENPEEPLVRRRVRLLTHVPLVRAHCDHPRRREPRGHVRPRCRPAAATIALVIVAAACGSDESSAPVSVVVPGTEQWTDTGIDLSIDDTVAIEADGEITPSTPDVPANDPDGHSNPAARRYNIQGLEQANHAGLIGRIGADGEPFHVGSQMVSTADLEGRLFLGINDGDVGNNAGEFTATVMVSPLQIDQAAQIIDRLFEVFNAEDAEGVADVFGDDAAFTLESGRDVVGADAATFWEGYFGVETFERVTDAFHASDGLTYFHGEVLRSGGLTGIYVFDVEMDGERLVRIGARPRNSVEIAAAKELDSLQEAFTDQDLDRLTEEFDGVTYSSASGEEFEGAEAAGHWAESFGSAVTRTTGVISVDGGPTGFVTERTEPGGISIEYVVTIEMAEDQVVNMTERRREP